MACGLSFATPAGLACALKDALPLTAETSQAELAEYGLALRDGLLRPVFSTSASVHLKMVALCSGLSILVAVAFWLLLLQKHFAGVKAMRWLLPVDCGKHGTAHLPEPRLAFTIPMTIASACLLASCMDQQAGHDPLDPIALNGLTTLLFCMAAWLQFPGAVYQSFRLRFGTLTVWINLAIWGTISIMFATMNSCLDDVITTWHRAYNDGLALHDALLDGNNLWNTAYAEGYTSYMHEIDSLDVSSHFANDKIIAFAWASLCWLGLTVLIYVPVAITGFLRPRTRPPTPGLGLDFGLQQQSLSLKLAELSTPTPSKPSTIFEDVELEESEEPPSFARQARHRLAAHSAFSLLYGSVAALCLAQPLLGNISEERAGWIWQSTILPGYTHALGALLVNTYLLITTLQETPAPLPVQLASPRKKQQLDKTPRTAFEVSPFTRQQMRAELMQRTPSFARTTPRRRNLSREFQLAQII